MSTNSYKRLVHKNPKLNDPALWYRVVDETNPEWYYATIWGKAGIVNSTIHAVPKSDYTVKEVKDNTPVPTVDEADEFI